MYKTSTEPIIKTFKSSGKTDIVQIINSILNFTKWVSIECLMHMHQQKLT